MDNKKIHLPSTEEEVKKLQTTWLGLLVYGAMKAELTAPSQESVAIVWDIDGTEVLRVEVNPPALVEPFGNLVAAYMEISYHRCDAQAWRQWAKLEVASLKKLSTLTLQEKVEQEIATIHSLAKREQAYNDAQAIFPLLSQLAGEQPPTLAAPSLDEVRHIFQPYLEHYYHNLTDDEINESTGFYNWLASEASDDDVRFSVSVISGYGCITLASFVGKQFELAIKIGKKKETSLLGLVKQALTNPIAEAIFELLSVIQGFGGDSNEATGKLWDAGIHPLAKKVTWQEIQQPHIVEGRFVISEAVHDAVCHLLDTVQQYTSRVTFSDILLKARSSHLLNSIKKASWNKRIDEERKARKKPDEIALDEVKEALGLSYEDMTDERIVEEILRRRQKKSGQPLVVDDMSARVENHVLLEQMANEPSLTPHEKQVLVLMTAKVEDGRVPTLEEIGQQMSITKVRVKQLLDSATSKLQGYNPFT